MKNLHLEFLLVVSAIAVAKASEKPQNNSSQLNALSDLRAAKWLIGNRAGCWDLTNDELNAIKEIDETIKSIKCAASDDNKSTGSAPASNNQMKFFQQGVLIKNYTSGLSNA